MYDWPETSSALDVLWTSASKNLSLLGISAPAELTRASNPFDVWSSSDLLVGQTCGWPYINQLQEKVIPFARFDHGLQDCKPGDYCSVYIGKHDSYADHLVSADAFSFVEKVAVNSPDSQSGFHVFAEITKQRAEMSIPGEKRLITGAHRNSLIAVANGQADLAAIDAVAFELAKHHEPEAVSQIVVLGTSRSLPGLPLITSRENSSRSDQLLEAISKAIEETPQDALDALLIRGVVKARHDDYKVFA